MLLAENFNPLPRKEGDIEGLAPLAEKIGISIHSLVKRETQYCLIAL